MTTIRKARVAEASAIKKLLDGYEAENVIPRPLSYIYENIRDFYVADGDVGIVGCCALHVMWADLAEVKSLAVTIEKKKQGLGRKLVEACLTDAKTMGIPKVFTLTAVPAFFEKIGFHRIDKQELPIKIWGECMQCIHYPDCCEEALILEV